MQSIPLSSVYPCVALSSGLRQGRGVSRWRRLGLTQNSWSWLGVQLGLGVGIWLGGWEPAKAQSLDDSPMELTDNAVPSTSQVLEERDMLAAWATDVWVQRDQQYLQIEAESNEVAEAASETELPRLKVSARFRRVLFAEIDRQLRLRESEIRLEDMASRSRSSAFFPDFSLRLVRGNDSARRWSPALSEVEQWSWTGGDDWLVEGRLQWRLDGTQYQADEMSAERSKIAIATLRSRIFREVGKSLGEWIAAKEQLSSPQISAIQRRSLLRILENNEGMLDAWSDAWFSEHIGAEIVQSHSPKAVRTPKKASAPAPVTGQLDIEVPQGMRSTRVESARY